MSSPPPMPQIRRMFADKGSSEPFFARLWMNLLELRDRAIAARFHDEQLEARRKEYNILARWLKAFGIDPTNLESRPDSSPALAQRLIANR